MKIPITILSTAIEVFRFSYSDTETCKRFDLKRINHAAENTMQFFEDNGIYFQPFDSRFRKLIYLFWYEVEIRRVK